LGKKKKTVEGKEKVSRETDTMKKKKRKTRVKRRVYSQMVKKGK